MLNGDRSTIKCFSLVYFFSLSPFSYFLPLLFGSKGLNDVNNQEEEVEEEKEEKGEAVPRDGFHFNSHLK